MTIDLAPVAAAPAGPEAADAQSANGDAFAAVVDGVVARDGGRQGGGTDAGADAGSDSGSGEGSGGGPGDGGAQLPGRDRPTDPGALAASSVVATLVGLTLPLPVEPVTQAVDPQAALDAIEGATPLPSVDVAAGGAADGIAPSQVALGDAAPAAQPVSPTGVAVPAPVEDAPGTSQQLVTSPDTSAASHGAASGDGAASGGPSAADGGSGAQRSAAVEGGAPSVQAPPGGGPRPVRSPATPAQPGASAAAASTDPAADLAAVTDAETSDPALPSNPAPTAAPTHAPAEAAVVDVHPVAAAGGATPRTAPPAVDGPIPTPHVVDVPDQPDPNVARLGGAIRSIRSGEGHQLTLGLTPEHLGRVTIDVVTGRDGGVHLHLRAERPEGAAALNNATHGLRADLESGGLRLDRVEVSVGQGGGGNGRHHHPGGPDAEPSDLPRGTRLRAAVAAPADLPPLTTQTVRADRLDLHL